MSDTPSLINEPAQATCTTEWVNEAQVDPLFKQLWNVEADLSFRPYASAAIAFAHVVGLSGEARATLFHEIATEPRAALLDRLSGLNGWNTRMRLLPKTAYASFAEDDWRALFQVTSDNLPRHILGHMAGISPIMVAQLAHVPEALRSANILAVLNQLRVSPKHWSELFDAIHETPPDILTSVMAKAKLVDSIGSFWDFYFSVVSKPWESFDLPPAFLASPMLRVLRTQEELQSEGLKMRNCLPSRAPKIRAGREAYFSWKGDVPASVQFLCTSRWHIGRILGVQNQPVDLSVTTDIRFWAELILADLKKEDQNSLDVSEEGIEGVRKEARALFSVTQQDDIADRLRDIRGKSKGAGAGTNAYCIFGGANGYIQFMADVDGHEFLCEVQSHHYFAPVQMHLTDGVVEILENCGFQWPSGEQNFIRWITVDGDNGIAALAEFTLGILCKVFGHRPGDAMKIKLHVP